MVSEGSTSLEGYQLFERDSQDSYNETENDQPLISNTYSEQHECLSSLLKHDESNQYETKTTVSKDESKSAINKDLEALQRIRRKQADASKAYRLRMKMKRQKTGAQAPQFESNKVTVESLMSEI